MRFFKSSLLILAGVMVPLGAFAQGVLEEVIVTAQKREQSMQDVGIAINAFSGEQIKALGITNTVDITQQIPGLQVTTFSPNLTAFNIRGVSQNNFTDNLEAPIAVYIDGAYVASMNAISGQLFDVERVEALKGPQGTLFGRNATGGVIHYITKGADEEELNGYAEVSAGEFGKFTYEGAIGGSITDTVRYRISARQEESDGYIEAADFPEGNPLPSSGQDLGGADGYAIRGVLQFDIGDSGTFDLSVKYSEDDGVPTGGYSFLPYADLSNPDVFIPPEFEDFVTNVIGAPAAATGDIFFCPSQLDCFAPVDNAGRTVFNGDSPSPFNHFSDFAGFLDRETTSVTGTLDYDLANGMNLVSITNFTDLDKFYTEDGDGIPVPIIEFTTVSDFDQFTQEFRLSGETDSTRWQVGVYYLDTETDADVITVGAPVSGVAADLGFDPTTLTGAEVIQDYNLSSENISIFGQIEWDLSAQTTLITGLRWSDDDKQMDFETGFQADGIDLIPSFNVQQAIAAAGGGDQDTIDYSDFAFRLGLDYQWNDDTLAFASINRGIKGGNFAPSANVTLANFRHDEEVLTSFEVGVKTELWDGRARFNATAFYYDYDDYQAFTFATGTPSVSNADAENLGLELELFMTPTANWDVVLGASFQDSEVDNVQTPQFQTTPVGFVVDWPVDFLNGVELPNAPSASLNYLFRYNRDFEFGNVALQLDGVWYDDQFLEVSNGGAAFQEAYNTSNASITWASLDEKWQVTGWVKNLSEEVYKQYALDLGILGGTVVYAPPRWAGVNVSYNF